MADGSPVPGAVAAELERVVRRWQQLPLDHALSYAPQVRGLAQELAHAFGAGARVRDLGPATALDQLVVTVFDACGAGLAEPLQLEERLIGLRRSLQ